MSIPPPVLQTFDLAKSYRRGPEVIHALTGVSLTLPPSELIALVGPSGSGKTTLLNLLCGWEEPDSGRFVWSSTQELDSPRDLGWRDIAIVPQALGLLDELTIRENIELPARLAADRSPGDAHEQALIDDLGLSDLADRMPSEASLGEQQRAAIARALALEPRLLLADEPTGHQDALWAQGVMRSLRRACTEGMACAVATHNAEILRYVDRIVHIRDGRLRDDAEAGAAREPV